MNSGITDMHSVWEALQGGEEHHFSKGWQVFSLGEKKSSYLAPGTRQSIEAVYSQALVSSVGLELDICYFVSSLYAPHKEGAFPWHDYK